MEETTNQPTTHGERILSQAGTAFIRDSNNFSANIAQVVIVGGNYIEHDPRAQSASSASSSRSNLPPRSDASDQPGFESLLDPDPSVTYEGLRRVSSRDGRDGYGAKAKAYVRNMLKEGYGMPCWDPRRSAAPPHHTVKVGDAGIYRQGKFEKIFNLWEPLVVACLENFIQVARPQLQWPALDIKTSDPRWFERGKDFVQGVKRRSKGGGIRRYPKTYKWTTFDQEGAVLAMLSQATQTQLSDRCHQAVQEFIEKEPFRFYVALRWLSEGRLNNGETLYIVTSVVKARAWAMAGFEDASKTESTLSLNRRMHKYDFAWKQEGTAETLADKSPTRENDQPLFLLGFSLTASDENLKRWEEAVEDLYTRPFHGGLNGLPPGCTFPGPPYNYGPPGAGGTPFYSHSGQTPDSYVSSVSQHGNKALKDAVTRWAGLRHEIVPGPFYEDAYPSKAINELILEHTNSVFSLTHDNDWRDMLVGQHCSNTGWKEFISAFTDRHPGFDIKEPLMTFAGGWPTMPNSLPGELRTAAMESDALMHGAEDNLDIEIENSSDVEVCDMSDSEDTSDSDDLKPESPVFHDSPPTPKGVQKQLSPLDRKRELAFIRFMLDFPVPYRDQLREFLSSRGDTAKEVEVSHKLAEMLRKTTEYQRALRQERRPPVRIQCYGLTAGELDFLWDLANGDSTVLDDASMLNWMKCIGWTQNGKQGHNSDFTSGHSPDRSESILPFTVLENPESSDLPRFSVNWLSAIREPVSFKWPFDTLVPQVKAFQLNPSVYSRHDPWIPVLPEASSTSPLW